MDSEYCPPSLGLTAPPPSIYPQCLCTSFPECLSLRFQLLKNSGNAASCRKSSLTAHSQALVLWPFVMVSDTHTGSRQGIDFTQPVIPPSGKTVAIPLCVFWAKLSAVKGLLGTGKDLNVCPAPSLGDWVDGCSCLSLVSSLLSLPLPPSPVGRRRFAEVTSRAFR